MLDLLLGLKNLKGNVLKEMMDLLVKWLLIFSRNKYQLGFTQEENVIWLSNDVIEKAIPHGILLNLKKLLNKNYKKLKR